MKGLSSLASFSWGRGKWACSGWECVGGSCRGTMDRECHMTKTGAQETDAFELNLVKQIDKFIFKYS